MRARYLLLAFLVGVFALIPLAVSGQEGGRPEGSPEPPPEVTAPGSPVDPDSVWDGDGPRARDQVILDDLIVDGSICAGLDCVNGESFGFDTIRLKENNLRIKFQDTSTSASFPSNDWQITANDSSNGGANKFSIDDISGGRTPFTLEAAAPSHSLYVDDGGRLGFGTNAPVVELHVKDGDTPTLRLEQDGSSGFTPQTWDVAGNETNFFVRDASNGSKLPFRIRPNAPSDSIFVDTDGDIGLGTSSPGFPLHVVESATPVVQRSLLELSNNGFPAFNFVDSSAGLDGFWGFGQFTDNAFVMNNAGTGPIEFTLARGGNMAISGTLSQGSDRNAKTNIEPVDPQSVLDSIAVLPISEWTYISDPSAARHLGPMAQDFSTAFGLGSDETKIAPIDTGGVALAGIQALIDENEALQGQVDDLEDRLAHLEALVAQLAD